MTDNPKTLHLERVFDATPEAVWAAWADAEQYAKWLNPAPGLDAVVHEWDFREGGRANVSMPQPDGRDSGGEGMFHVINPPHLLVQGSPDKSFLITTRIEPVGKRTRLVVEVVGIPPEYHEMATQGWNVCFDQMQVVIIKNSVRATGADVDASAKGFTIERTFRAAPEKVWEMWTTKEGLMQWWAPSAEEMGYRFTVLKLDVRVSGEYAFEMANDAHALVNRGTYRVVSPPRKLAWTWHYDIFLAPDEKPYDVPISVELHEAPDGTRMVFTQGPLASPEYTEGSRQGVMANFEKLAKALGE